MIRTRILSSVLVAVVLLGTAARSAPSPFLAQLPLPRVSQPLDFEPGTSEIALDDLLMQFARLTGYELAMSAPTSMLLVQTKERLERSERVPAEEVYTFVEGLLARQGFVIAPVTGGTRPILGVYSPGGGRDLSPDPMYVESSALAELALHPALHVRFLLNLKNMDTRQVQTQLRQLTVDNSGVTQIVPVGEHALILQGRGSDMASLAKLLLAADEATRERPPAPSAKPEEGQAK